MGIIESGVNLEDRLKDLEVRNAVANMRNAATSSLAKYDLADQAIDDFQTTAGLDTSFSGYLTTHATGYIKGGSAPDSDTVVLISGEGNPDSTISNNTVITAANIGNYGQAASESNLAYSGAWTINSSPQFRTGISGFGTYVMYFDGSDDYIQSAANPAGFNIGAPSSSNGDWTLECWIRLAASNPGGTSIIGYNGPTGAWGDIGYAISFVDTTTSKVIFATGGGPNQEAIPSGGRPTTEWDNTAWHHICLINSGEDSSTDATKMARMFLDGAHVANGTASSGTINSDTDFKFNIVGYVYPQGGGSFPTVYMQDIRFSTVARYDRAGSGTDFTAPTTSLLSGGGGGIDASNMVAVSTSTTASAAPDKGDLVMMYEDTAGTATINTDIKGYVSRNGGTTFTEGTLVSEGALGTSKIVAFHDLDISGQSSATAMRYKITTHNQSASKETKVTGVALGWH
jgi:hypothetical protein